MSRRSGQILARGERKWLVRIYLGSHPDTGRRVYHSETVHGAKKSADARMRDLLTKRDLGMLLEPSTITLGAYLDRWLEHTETSTRPRTAQDYRRFLDRYVLPALGARPLAKLNPLELQTLMSSIGDETSPHAARRTHAVLRSALRQAVRWRYLAQSPMEGVQAPREQRSEMVALSAAQAKAFRAAAARSKRGFVFVFSLATGMRPGEVQALRWADCDLEAGIVRVEQALAWVDGPKDAETGKPKGKVWKFGAPKTKLSRRAIPLPASVAAELRAHRREQAKWRLKLGEAYEDHDLVFAGELGAPISNTNLSRRVLKPILKAAKLPEDIQARFRWYDCRHTCATLLLEAGVNPKIVSERLGHSTVAFTLDRYAHVLPGQQAEASERLEAVLG